MKRISSFLTCRHSEPTRLGGILRIPAKFPFHALVLEDEGVSSLGVDVEAIFISIIAFRVQNHSAENHKRCPNRTVIKKSQYRLPSGREQECPFTVTSTNPLSSNSFSKLLIDTGSVSRRRRVPSSCMGHGFNHRSIRFDIMFLVTMS